MDSLSTRLAKIREQANTSISTPDSDAIEFPLWAILMIWSKAHHVTYIDYMKGGKLLINWLSPIAITDKAFPYYSYNILSGWTIREVSELLKITESAVVNCLVTEVLPREQGLKGLKATDSHTRQTKSVHQQKLDCSWSDT